MNRVLVWAILICGFVSLAPGERKPENLTLTIAHLAESGYPGEYLFVINGLVAFKTLEGLKRHLEDNPKGSTLTWSPGCMRSGNETKLDSAKHLQAFKAYCDSIGTKFIVVPSG